MNLLVYGSKDFAATVCELVRCCGNEVAGMVDDYSHGPNILGGLESVAQTHPPRDYGMAIAIGYNNIQARWDAWKKVRSFGYRAPTLIHPRAQIADTARIGEGAIIMLGAIVDVRVEIGQLTVIWPGACVNHDSKIGPNTFLSPNSTVCGTVTVGAHSFIGAGAVVVDHSSVPDGTYVKALECYVNRKT